MVSSMDTSTMTPLAIARTLAARADCDARTARRALREGVLAIRSIAVRERLDREMRVLGLDPDAGTNP
jgi:hypothetical protein